MRAYVFDHPLTGPGYGDAVMKDPEPPARADYVLVESTYGDRRHEQVDPTKTLGDHVERCVERGGTVVIPAFAVGRVQSLLYHFSRLRAQGRLRDIPIFLDSPMAINASGLMCDFMDEHRLARAECEAACSVAHYVREVEESKELTANPTPKVIISASGMATGGRVLHHLKRFAPDGKNLILFSGFQAAGTRGAAMIGGARTIKIHGEYIPVEAEVANLTMLSAHADSDELMRWLGREGHESYKQSFLQDNLALFSAFLDAPIGPNPMYSGAQPSTAVETILASISKLLSFANCSSQIKVAAAPSVKGEDVAAVTVPF